MRHSIHRPGWPDVSTRLEAHYGDRVVRCFIERAASVGVLLDAAVRANPTGEALISGDQHVSYAELATLVEVVATTLARNGIEKGDRVALLLANGIEFVASFHAVLRIGAVVVPLNIREQPPELRHILRDCGATAVIVHGELLSKLPLRCELPDLRFTIGVAGHGDVCWPECLDSATSGHRTDVGEEDVAAIVYTSGTAGVPKGAALTHLALVHAGMQYRETLALTVDDRLLVAVPLNHVTGLTGSILAALSAKATLVIAREFKAGLFLELAERERMTATILVPAMYKLLVLSGALARTDLGSWRIGGYGGAIMPPALIEELRDRLPALSLINCYGATETASPVAMMPPAFMKGRESSVGCAVPCGEIIVVDDDGRELPPGEPGEVWLRSATCAVGYWRNAEATQLEFTAGFWHSGDVGAVDDLGFLTILDRKKDMINRGGFKVYAAEVEDVLARHPDVKEAAVIGRPCPVLGERVHAVLVADDPHLELEGVRRLCSELLADFKVPETITVRAEPLPRNAGGKVLKRQLKEEMDASSPERAKL